MIIFGAGFYLKPQTFNTKNFIYFFFCFLSWNAIWYQIMWFHFGSMRMFSTLSIILVFICFEFVDAFYFNDSMKRANGHVVVFKFAPFHFNRIVSQIYVFFFLSIFNFICIWIFGWLLDSYLFFFSWFSVVVYSLSILFPYFF